MFGSPAEAVAGLIERLGACGASHVAQAVPLALSRGRILAKDILADRDSPPFDHAAMDGYAVRAAELRIAADAASDAVRVLVVGESRIGRQPPDWPVLSEPSHQVQAIRIATGAPLPPAADAVVKREDVIETLSAGWRAMEPSGCSSPSSILIPCASAARVRAGDHVRYRGENARSGGVILRRGEVVTPAAVGVLAAVGRLHPEVYAPMRVAIVSTGDEIVAPEAAPGPYQIRDSNSAALQAALASQAWVDVCGIMRVRDDADLSAILLDLAERSDAVVLIGGVSMGHRDPVRSAVEAAGAEVIFHGLPQRPGKPMLGACLRVVRRGDASRPGSAILPIFGLPGNPLSALVTCTRIVLPVLAAAAGAARLPPNLTPRPARVENPDGRSLPLWWHRPARVMEGDGRPPLSAGLCVRLVESRGSGDVIAGGCSDGFVELPPGPSDPACPSVPFYAWPM